MCGKGITLSITSRPEPVCLACRRIVGPPRALDKLCAYCSKPFTTIYDCRFCSRTCSGSSRRVHASQKERYYVKTLRRRAMKLAAYVEDVTPEVVYDRNDWICQLCHEPVDKTLHGWHKMAATLDHIIPLTQGGLHCYSNVQLAHRSCNSKKGAQWQGQLVLV
jgi:5-methylcytosine-specific restriction endonuclease McrA